MRRSILLLTTALALGAATAEAQPAAPAHDPAAAEVLFRAALDALDKGDWDVACAKFSASMSLDPAASTLVNVAKCHDHEGKLTVAWAELNRALTLSGDIAGQQRKADLDQYTRGLLAALEPRLPKLTIVVRERPAGLRITRDGVEISGAALGDALPVDPGAHAIEASAPGYASETRTVEVAEGKAATVELTLLPIAPIAPTPQTPLTPLVVAPRPPSPSGPTRRQVAFVASGIGLAGGALGAVTGGLMLSKKAVASADCTSAAAGVALCKSIEGVNAGNSAKMLGTVATVGWVTALAGLGVGTVLLVTAPRAASPSQARSRGSVSAGLWPAETPGAVLGVKGDW